MTISEQVQKLTSLSISSFAGSAPTQPELRVIFDSLRQKVVNTWPEAEQSFTEFSKQAPANLELEARIETFISEYAALSHRFESLERDNDALWSAYLAEIKKSHSQKGDLKRLERQLDRALTQNRTMQERHDDLAKLIEQAQAALRGHVVT